MIIADLNYLEGASEASNIVGGRRRNSQTARGNRSNNANAANVAVFPSSNFAGGSVNGGNQSIDIDFSQTIDQDQDLEGANNNSVNVRA